MFYDGAVAPSGEKYAGSGTTDASFTGQSTDTQNGLYDFLYREYSITQGRWTSPDPAGINAADPANPQTWNRYAYVRNNVLSRVDPFGLRDCLPTDDACVVATPMPDDPPKKEKVPEVHDYADDLPHMILNPFQLHYEMPFRRFPAAPPFLPAKNGNLGWWKAFAKNLFSWKNFTDEFKQGGCVNVFGKATADALNPFSPSLSSAGEGTAAVLAASKYNAAVQYAASAPNYLGGTGLIYPMKSSIVRGMIADANATAASGGMMSVDLALAQGFGTEMYSMATGGCH
ncbi:MAG: RHS repeat-associated core domain-containing protein [Acidobacteria bacterium]|nr:RHS repeat-associated core domain-containing protein [Acidobacteriota bacterium]